MLPNCQVHAMRMTGRGVESLSTAHVTFTQHSINQKCIAGLWIGLT